MERNYKELSEFILSIKKANGPRKYKVTNSLGVYDSYKWIRRNKWLNIGKVLTEHEFYSIIRKVNNYLADSFIEGYNIVFPHKMGQIELRKFDATFKIDDGKVKTNLPIDWDKTLKLWYEDEEAYKKKTLVKMEEKEIFKIFYNRNIADYSNKCFYEFKANRELKTRLKCKIKEGRIDAFKLKEDD